MKTKRIYINGRFLTMPVTGVQRYSLEIVHHMDSLLNDNDFPDLQLICLAPPQDFTLPSWKNIEIRKVGINQGNLWEQFDLPRYLKGQLLFSPANIGPWYYANQAVTLHDASVFSYPETYSFAFRTKYRFIFQQVAKRARMLLTVSKFSQQELARYLNISPDCLTVVPLGSDHLDSVPPDPEILKRYNLDAGSFMLVVASRSRHKNVDAVVQAAKLLPGDLKMVAVGGSFSQVFKKIGQGDISSEIQPLGYVTDQELKALYMNAQVLIAPSLYEGFGLPLVEAMRAGCPVICSQAASHPEVAGDAALYFDPENVEDIARTIKEFLSDPDLQEDLRHKGSQQAKKYAWSASAAEILGYLRKSMN